MRKVDRKPDSKPAEPKVGGHDPNRGEARAPGPAAPAPLEKSKPYRRPEDLGGKRGKAMRGTAEPPGEDKDIFDDERSDRSSGRPLQLGDQEPATRQAPRPEPDPGQRPGRDRRGPKEPLEH